MPENHHSGTYLNSVYLGRTLGCRVFLSQTKLPENHALHRGINLIALYMRVLLGPGGGGCRVILSQTYSYCRFSLDVTKIQTTKLLILPIYYFNDL